LACEHIFTQPHLSVYLSIYLSIYLSVLILRLSAAFHVALDLQLLSPVPLPRGGGFGGLSPPKQCSKPPKLKRERL